jgi:hypothetical protein
MSQIEASQITSHSLEFDLSWQDAFGSLLASLEHGSHHRSVALITTGNLGQVALEATSGLQFRGRLVLAILEQLHGAPLAAILRDQAPNVVIALEPGGEGIATQGPAIAGNPSLERASTGLEYAEPGSYPAWKNRDALPTDPQASSVIGSVASSLDLPCFVCDPTALKLALERAFER